MIPCALVADNSSEPQGAKAAVAEGAAPSAMQGSGAVALQ